MAERDRVAAADDLCPPAAAWYPKHSNIRENVMASLVIREFDTQTYLIFDDGDAANKSGLAAFLVKNSGRRVKTMPEKDFTERGGWKAVLPHTKAKQTTSKPVKKPKDDPRPEAVVEEAVADISASVPVKPKKRW